eukprot:364849-Chlamydomonas_euryale.AAC.7
MCCKSHDSELSVPNRACLTNETANCKATLSSQGSRLFRHNAHIRRVLSNDSVAHIHDRFCGVGLAQRHASLGSRGKQSFQNAAWACGCPEHVCTTFRRLDTSTAPPPYLTSDAAVAKPVTLRQRC